MCVWTMNINFARLSFPSVTSWKTLPNWTFKQEAWIVTQGKRFYILPTEDGMANRLGHRVCGMLKISAVLSGHWNENTSENLLGNSLENGRCMHGCFWTVYVLHLKDLCIIYARGWSFHVHVARKVSPRTWRSDGDVEVSSSKILL